MLSLSKYLFCYSTLIEFLMVLLSRKDREFDLLEYNISIPPDYNDKDLLHFKIGTLHNTNKLFLFSKKKGSRKM